MHGETVNCLGAMAKPLGVKTSISSARFYFLNPKYYLENVYTLY